MVGWLTIIQQLGGSTTKLLWAGSGFSQDADAFFTAHQYRTWAGRNAQKKQPLAAVIVGHSAFDAFFGVVVIINALFIGTSMVLFNFNFFLPRCKFFGWGFGCERSVSSFQLPSILCPKTMKILVETFWGPQ